MHLKAPAFHLHCGKSLSASPSLPRFGLPSDLPARLGSSSTRLPSSPLRRLMVVNYFRLEAEAHLLCSQLALVAPLSSLSLTHSCTSSRSESGFEVPSDRVQ